MMKKKINQKRIVIDDVVERLKISKTGGGQWYTSKDLLCPDCGKGDGKFGIKLFDETGLCNCWRCGYKSSIFNYLYATNNYDLVSHDQKYKYEEELTNVFLPKAAPKPLKEESLPIGFELYSKIGYLESRGFEPWQYDQFKVGQTNSVAAHGWRDKVIFQILNNGKRVGILGRSKKSKEYHEKNLKEHQEGKAYLDTRYKNSDTDFNFILGGLDDISDLTTTVIIVEGIMDKANLDRLLKANLSPYIQVVFTFGSNISPEQITLLQSRKTVREVILFYDIDAIRKMRETLANLQKKFNTVYVALIDENKYGNKIDAGDINLDMFIEVIENMYEPDSFYSEKIIKKKFYE